MEDVNMFQQQQGFEQIDDNDVLWRYQDLPRYLDLLLRKRLFFTRIDQFEDPFEGQYNKQSREAILQKGSPDGFKEQHSHNRVAVTANTWHHNDEENYAMWNIYARGYGVAIRTSYKKLKDCFHVTDKPVYIGKVIYYNDHKESMPVENPLAPFIRKRCIYQYENEIRCCYVMSQKEQDGFTWEEQDTYNGVFIPVDLDLLIERVYISPYSPKWFRDLVARTNEAFQIQKEISQSSVFESENFL